MIKMALNLLKPHPLNAKIYGDSADADLVESIEANGILSPILVTSEKAEIGPNVIISGHRRYYAAKRLGVDAVPVFISDIYDAIDIEEAVIVANKQRQKNGEQIGREIQKLMDIVSKRARQRSLANLNNNNIPVEVGNLPPRGSSGKSRDVVGRMLGIGGTTAIRAAKAVTVIDDLLAGGEVEQAEEIRTALNKSVNSGYSLAKEHIDREERAASESTNKSTFNATNDNMHWAKWSWNPVTGCKFGCPYCYARDIAMRYTGHFDPTFHENRLNAPHNTNIPESRRYEAGIKNVFVCSMADLFGDWVSEEWINKVLDSIRKAPQWNFILLTKNPKRYLQFKFPDNCWIGATADTQNRADDALEVFDEMSKMGTKPEVTFLSCEPLSESISLPEFGCYIDWLIIGGRSRSSKLPEAQPEWEWVESLLMQARQNGIKLYFKPNLTVQPKEYPE